MTTPTEAGLLQAITERPGDDLPRRIYADWLDDNGLRERAELIRVQLDLAKGEDAEGRRRERELLAAHGPQWLGEVLPGWELRIGCGWMLADEGQHEKRQAAFWRGMVGVLFLPMRDFLENGERILTAVPTVRRVQLTDRRPQMTEPDGWRWVNDVFAGDSVYRSEAAALAALSRVCLNYARARAFPYSHNRVFTTGQVAKICKVAPRTVSKWFDSGRLRGYRIPGSQDRRIPRDQLISFLREHGLPLGGLVSEWEEGDLESTPAEGA